MTPQDDAYRRIVIAEADAAAGRVLRGSAPVTGLPAHRELMQRAKLLIAATLTPGSAFAGDPDAIARAEGLVAELAGLQGPSGLFAGGDNVESPPDSAFTVGDVADALALIRTTDDGRLAALAAALDTIARNAAPAMLTGGVHTPNHRWEIAGALARLHRVRPDDALRDRAEEWLAEGVDIQQDGMYSERSVNYAAYVSNPSLTAIADAFGRDDLRAIVARNLESFIGLIRPDGTVETLHSRRQDQREEGFPLSPLLPLYRRYAVELNRGDLAWAADRALAQGVAEPHTALAQLILEPHAGSALPTAAAPPASRRDRWEQSGIVIDTTPRRTLVAYGGSDYGRMRRIRSGLASNPTFLRLSSGEAVLSSARLSRRFFGLGPFRADRIAETPDGLVLEERVEGRYYQPLSARHRRHDGAYDLSDEGRFAAAMSFGERAEDAVTLHTRIEVVPTEAGADLTIAIDGPSVPWSLELAFRPGGRFEGVVPSSDGAHDLRKGFGRYTVGEDAIEFGPGASDGPRGFYHPGEDYSQLGATDAAADPRVFLTGNAPGTARVSLRCSGPRLSPRRER